MIQKTAKNAATIAGIAMRKTVRMMERGTLELDERKQSMGSVAPAVAADPKKSTNREEHIQRAGVEGGRRCLALPAAEKRVIIHRVQSTLMDTATAITWRKLTAIWTDTVAECVEADVSMRTLKISTMRCLWSRACDPALLRSPASLGPAALSPTGRRVSCTYLVGGCSSSWDLDMRRRDTKETAFSVRGEDVRLLRTAKLVRSSSRRMDKT